MLIALFVLLMAIMFYNHLVYPIFLSIFSRLRVRRKPQCSQNTEENTITYPSIHLIVPAYNEEKVIAEKIDNLCALDYPLEQLRISIICDGCSDLTGWESMNTRSRYYNREMDMQILVDDKNLGKVARINQAIEDTYEDVIIISDASALLGLDCLKVVAKSLSDRSVSAVTGDYQFATDNECGENSYWVYQSKIRQMESNLGSVIGATGAFCAIRTQCCKPLSPDTINDDFILPMQSVLEGGRIEFCANIKVWETEASNLQVDAKRRMRISQGNCQQVVRLFRLLSPEFGWVSWMFFSGKVLRLLTPLVLLLLMLLNIMLLQDGIAFSFLLIGQLSIYLMTLMVYRGAITHRVIKAGAYIVQAHIVSGAGICMYIFNALTSGNKAPWTKITK